MTRNRRLWLIWPLLAFVLIIACLAISLYKINKSPAQANMGPGYYIGNFHTHTLESDGSMSYHEAVEKASSLGFAFLAITDHNIISYSMKYLCTHEKRLLCIPGEEISTEEGHLLAIGISDEIKQGLAARDTVRKIHEQGGLAVPAHPGKDSGITRDIINGLGMDAVECTSFSIREDGEDSCSSFAQYARVYDSDAHNINEMEAVASMCYLANLSLEAIKEAVRTGNCSVIIPESQELGEQLFIP